jgi:predicted permease
MDTALQDLRYALRQLRASPGFTTAAVLTVGLGIGANTAIFSLINALLLRPLPHIARPHEIVQLGRTVEGEGFDTFSYPDYADVRDWTTTLAGVAAHRVVPMHLSGFGATERGRGALVSANYFAVLGTEPALGRFFHPDEDRPGSPAMVAVLSAGLWVRAFGGRPDVIGSTIRINSHAFAVVGVAPVGFQGTIIGDQLDVYVPLSTQPLTMGRFGPMLATRNAVWLQVVGRLAPRTSPARAGEEMDLFGTRLAAAFPEQRRGWSIAVAQGAGFNPDTRRDVAAFLRILQGAVALVLAIACANVAHLLLVRGSARRKELALRASLGAARGRLVRQLLTESVVLSALGGLVGLVLAYWSSGLLSALPTMAFPGTVDLGPDSRVLLFALSVSIVTGVVFGIVPALYAARSDLASDLRAGAQSTRRPSARLRSGLVVAQLAVSLVLLVAAGLFVRTLRNAYAIPPGFATRDVVVARLDFELQGYDSTRGRRAQDELLARLQALPGVRSASLTLNLPFGGGFDTRIAPVGEVITPENRGHRTDRNSVTADYFTTMDIPFLRGRGFDAQDASGSPLVAVVNQAIAERLWPGQDPIGKRFFQTWGSPPLEVIGVVRDAKYRSLFEERRLTFYQPLAQNYQAAVVVHLRSSEEPAALAGAIERTVHELDPDLPVYRVQTLAERLAASLAQQRTAATLVGVFGALALLLAAIGLYSAVAYAVAQRTREIGIRIALGARAPDVLRQVLRQGIGLGVLGLGIGLAGALAVTRVLRAQLYGVTPTDPVSFAAVSLLLVVVAVLGSYAPARRATRVDPMVALRD